MKNKKFEELPDVLNLWPDVANLLGISRNSVYGAARRGEIPTIRIGKRLLVAKTILMRILFGEISK